MAGGEWDKVSRSLLTVNTISRSSQAARILRGFE